MLSSAGRSGRCAACRKCLQCKRNCFFSIRLTAFFFVKKAGPPGFPLPCPFLLGKERCGGTAPKKNTFFRYARLSTRKRFRKEKPKVSPSFGPGSQAPQARILSRLYYGPTFNICLAKYKSPNKRSIFPFTERESVRFKNGDCWMAKVCSNCGRQVQTATEFPCPSCGKSHIIRCATCRKEKNSYTCVDCGFQGP